ncbi:HAD family hydrolase [Bacillus sp. FJAT-49705]|uniref:HAD family hydrolase n=1 Tax=Cytobacillus citreus TaxID=2833586 RepID=A0ABS5NVL6_9BACI|nr:HAD family hydrolase [Cytobacillus citreus]MBS4191880.1 HAD family hydrolase [Cytobacillus citreus]
MKKKVFIFDLDGTLYHDMAFVEAYIELITSDHWIQDAIKNELNDILNGVSEIGLNDTINNQIGSYSLGDPWQVILYLSRKYEIQEAKQIEAFYKVREQMIQPGFALKMNNTYIETVKNLDDVKILMTNSPEENASTFVHLFGLNHAFDHYYYDAKKPTGMSTYVKEIQKMYPDHEIISIGDNYINDIKPCQDIGIKGIYINHFNIPINEQYIQVVQDLKELNEVLMTTYEKRKTH